MLNSYFESMGFICQPSSLRIRPRLFPSPDREGRERFISLSFM